MIKKVLSDRSVVGGCLQLGRKVISLGQLKLSKTPKKSALNLQRHKYFVSKLQKPSRHKVGYTAKKI